MAVWLIHGILDPELAQAMRYAQEALECGLPMDRAKRPTDEEMLDSLNKHLSAAVPVPVERSPEDRILEATRERGRNSAVVERDPRPAAPGELVALVLALQAAAAAESAEHERWQAGNREPDDDALYLAMDARVNAMAAMLAWAPAPVATTGPSGHYAGAPVIQIGDYVTLRTQMIDEDGAEFYNRVRGLEQIERAGEVIWSAP